MAVAVDLYDLGGCLGLWAKSWCSAVGPVVEYTTDVEVLAQLSWIAWVFGDKVMFQLLLDRLTMEVEVDGKGGLVDAGGLQLEDMKFMKAMDLLGESLTIMSLLLLLLSWMSFTTSAKPAILTIAR